VALFRLSADVKSANLDGVVPVLAELVGGDVTTIADGVHVEGVLDGADVRDVNRRMLSALRRVERRTRSRAEWTCDGQVYRFFDYALKSQRPA
jgi:hypothetical protein